MGLVTEMVAANTQAVMAKVTDIFATGIKTNIFFSVASWAPKFSNSGAQPKS